MLKNILLLVYSLLLYSCVSIEEPAYFYNEVVVRNNTNSVVQDVTIRASQSGRMFGCSSIAPQGQCSNQFPKRQYLKSPIRIDWMLGNRNPQTKEFILEVTDTFDPSAMLRGVLEIRADGSIRAFFEQDSSE